MATITPTNVEFGVATALPSAVTLSASDVIATAGYPTAKLTIAIVSGAEAGEKSLELTFKAGIGTNAVADKTYTVAPATSVIISGFEAARFMKKDGNINISSALSTAGSGGALSDYPARIYIQK